MTGDTERKGKVRRKEVVFQYLVLKKGNDGRGRSVKGVGGSGGGGRGGGVGVERIGSDFIL